MLPIYILLTSDNLTLQFIIDNIEKNYNGQFLEKN